MNNMLRGMLALLILVVLVVGLPVLLYRLGGSPIPGHLPSLRQIGHALARRDNGSLFLAAVRDITWLAWAAFSIAVLAEIQAAVRGRAAPRLWLGGMQALAARLVVLTVLGISGPTVLATAAQAAPAAQVITDHPLPLPGHAGGMLIEAAAAGPGLRATEPGVTAPALAGPGATAPALAAAEPAVAADSAEPPAALMLASDQLAQTQQAGAQVMSMSQYRLVTVHPGDCLWTLAEHYLGNGDRYPEIVSINLGRDMGGVIFSDPSVIWPGWVLRMPASGGPGAPAVGHSNGRGTHAGGGTHDGGTHDGGTAGHGGQQGTHGRHDPHPSREPWFRQPHPSASATPAQQPASSGVASGHPTAAEPSAGRAEVPPIAVFAAGMLAGGATVSLARMRNRQRQSRRPGRRIPLPEAAPVIAAEQRMRADAAGLIPANWLRAALSELGAGLAETGQQVPEIAAVRILPQLMEILLASPASEPPPLPFTVPAGRQGMTWRLTVPDDAPEYPTAPMQTGDLAPGLVTIGISDGGYLLADLEYLGVTVAYGPPDAVDQVLATAAAELATSELAGWYDLILIGFPELRHVGSRTTCCDDLATALDLAAVKAVTLRRRLGDAGPAAVRRLRVADPGDEDWALTLLVSRIAATSAELALLTDLVSGPGGAAALLPAGPGLAESPGTVELEIDYDRGQPGGLVARVRQLSLQAFPQPLTDSDYRALTSLFAVAAQDGDVAPDSPPYDRSSWPPVPPPGQGADEADHDGTLAPDRGRNTSGDSATVFTGWQLPVATDHEGRPADASVEPDMSWRRPAVADQPERDQPDRGQPDSIRPDSIQADRGATAASSPDASWRRAGAPEQPEASATADPAANLRIGVLGTLTVNGQPGALLPAQSQLIVALALNGREGLSNRQLCYLLGADPDHPRPPDSLRQLIVRTRRQLGVAGDGREWIEHLGGGQYALHPSTRVDWTEFNAMTSTGISHNDRQLLSDALRMIRGQPFTGCYYWWLDVALVETVRAQIVDAAELLASLDLADGSPASSARAARIGLAADSAAEQLWRALMRAEHAAGNLTGVREAWNRCLEVIAEIAADGQPHPDTASLYRDLLGGSSTRFPGSWARDR
jgi:DNA-binding SARP family transcriptional activator